SMAVLKCVPPGVAGDLGTVIRKSLEEGLQRGKSHTWIRRIGDRIEAQRAAKIVIEHLHDRGAPELVSQLHIMTAEFPGVVVYEMPVGIDAVARHRRAGANLREATHFDRRQSAVI